MKERHSKRITIHRRVDDEICLQFIPIYREAFAPLETLSVARQTFDDEDLLQEMTDQSAMKFIGWDEHGEPCALLIVATDLTRVRWINSAYFEARWPDQFRARKIYYHGVLLVRVSHQRGLWAEALIEASIRRVLLDGALAVGDFCRFNVEVVGIPQMIGRITQRFAESEPVEIDRQHYFTFPQTRLHVSDAELLDASYEDIEIDLTVPPRSVDIDLVALESKERTAVPRSGEPAR